MSSKGALFFPSRRWPQATEKPPDSGGQPQSQAKARLSSGRSRSEPFGPAFVQVRPVLVIYAAFHPAVPPASAVKPAVPMGQDGEAALLGVIQRLVEGIGRIGH